VAAALLLAASPAVARMHAGPNVLHAGHRLQGAIAPLDGGGAFASSAAAYSLRKLKSTYAGPGIKLRRASDNATQDINFLGFTGFTGAPLDVAAAASFCNATTCFVDTWYDQSGQARNVTQATPGYQPQYIASCVTGKPCLRPVADPNGYLISASVAWTAARTTLSAVGNRTSGTGNCTLSSKHISLIGSHTVANQWLVSDQTTNNFALSAADNAWHAGIGVVDGAASLGRIDATETVGTNVTGSAAAGSVLVARGNTGTVCSQVEALVWDNYVLAPAERAALTQNQRDYWGF
jgi:hypothetical protein